MNEERLLKIINEYGTPSYVFDEDEVRERAGKIKSLIDGKLCFSIKANPFLVPCLIDAVDRFEACSPGELYICEHHKVPGEMIVYSGVHKEKEDIDEAISYGAGIITAESKRQYELICESAAMKAGSLNNPVRVVLRLTSESQFGMSPEDMEDILTDYEKNRETKAAAIEIAGIHYFAGTQRLKLDHQKKELERLHDMIEALRAKYGIPLDELEYGPGLGYPYFKDGDFSDTLKPMKELADDLNAAAKWCSLTVEMGRFLASSCGYYLTAAADIKASSDKNWIIVDGGIHHLNYLGQRMGLKVPVIKLIKRNDDNDAAPRGSDMTYDICGSLCTTNDVLVRGCSMDEVKIGDVMVFCHAGAYSVTESMQLFLSRTMPKIIMAGPNGETLVRDAIDTWKINCAPEP